MKKLLLIAVLVSPFLMTNAFAENDLQKSLQEVIKKREANLEKIVEIIEKNVMGERNLYIEEDLYAARIVLLSFKRDIATSINDKIILQKQIVKISEEAISLSKKRKDQAVINIMDSCKLEENLLKAQQELIELEIKKNKRA